MFEFTDSDGDMLFATASVGGVRVSVEVSGRENWIDVPTEVALKFAEAVLKNAGIKADIIPHSEYPVQRKSNGVFSCGSPSIRAVATATATGDNSEDIREMAINLFAISKEMKAAEEQQRKEFEAVTHTNRLQMLRTVVPGAVDSRLDDVDDLVLRLLDVLIEAKKEN